MADPEPYDPFFPPEVKRRFEASKRPPVTTAEILAGMESRALDFGNVDGRDSESWNARMLACELSPAVVGVSSLDEGENMFCSGIVIDKDGLILTAASVLGNFEETKASDIKVNILLPSSEKVVGLVVHVDKFHNVAFIHVSAHFEVAASLEPDSTVVYVGQKFFALGRHYQSNKFMASIGEVNIRQDHLDSDDLLSSSCSISKCGIGGPLIELSSRCVVGMNVDGGGDCPFLAWNFVMRCLGHFKSYGKVVRPWLGLRTRPLNELKLHDLESVFQKFNSYDGLLVKKVINGSPADHAGVCQGDIIFQCQGTPVNSPVGFADVLFEHTEMDAPPLLHRSSGRGGPQERRKMNIEVVIGSKKSGSCECKSIVVESFSPLERNQ